MHQKPRSANDAAGLRLAGLPALDGYAWERDTAGESGGAVHRLRGSDGAPDLFLKHGKDALAADIADEMARLRWLGRYLPVPALAHFACTPDQAWLLTAALPGKTAYRVLQEQPGRRLQVVEALAGFLRRIHAIPVAACPFNAGHAYRLACARARIDAGQVDGDDFDDERAGWSAEQVWDAMQALLPLAPDAVVTHGDYSLDNLLLVDGQVAGCIDVGRAGVADRYQDLAVMWNCLGEFGPALQAAFLERYGLGEVERDKLRFHLMLDELF